MKKGLDRKKDFSALFFAFDRSSQKVSESFMYSLISKEKKEVKKWITRRKG